MRCARVLVVGLAAWASAAPGEAVAGLYAFHGHGHGHGRGQGGFGGFGGFGFGFGYGFGFGSFGFPVPWPVLTPVFVPVVVDRGALAGPMPAPVPAPDGAPPAARAKRPEATRARQLVTIGDRLFRAGNLRRAAERFEQARRADPDDPIPLVHLAQVALVRGQYGEAANLIREAVDADPGWVLNARDIQAIYAEPADFARQIGRLESRVLAEPNDRDAWLVLGAELYLSGQTRRAADIFVRLTDRRPDAALTAFLDATDARPDR